jgi:hypothetical protein
MWMNDFLHGRFYIAISALMGIILQPFGAIVSIEVQLMKPLS